MTRGRTPTPLPILQARGSRAARGRAGEVQFELGAPPCPPTLKGEARAEWRRQVKQLGQAGVLQKVDAALLAAYCDAWATFVALRDRVQQLLDADPVAGLERAISLGLLKNKNTAIQLLTKLAAEFGFSAAARARVRAGDTPQTGGVRRRNRNPPTEADELAEFLAGTVPDSEYPESSSEYPGGVCSRKRG